MEFVCVQCGADLDGGDVYEHYLAETGDTKKALKYARMVREQSSSHQKDSDCSARPEATV